MFGDPSNPLAGYVRYNHKANYMILRTNGNTSMTIDSSRNVAIEGNVSADTGTFNALVLPGGIQDTSYRTAGRTYGMVFKGDGFGNNLNVSDYFWMESGDFSGDVGFTGNIFNLYREYETGNDSRIAFWEAVSDTVFSFSRSGDALKLQWEDSTGADYPNPWTSPNDLITFTKDTIFVHNKLKARKAIIDTNFTSPCSTFSNNGTTYRGSGTAYICKQGKLCTVKVPSLYLVADAGAYSVIKFPFTLSTPTSGGFYGTFLAEVSGTYQVCVFYLNNSSTMTLYTGSRGNFPAGTVNIMPFSVSYEQANYHF